MTIDESRIDVEGGEIILFGGGEMKYRRKPVIVDAIQWTGKTQMM